MFGIIKCNCGFWNASAIHSCNKVKEAIDYMPVKVSGIKYDGGKERMDLISPIAVRELAKVLGAGAIKYGDSNWRAGIKWSRVIAAALRHIFSWLRGETHDRETGLNHLAHAMCNLHFLLEYTETHPELDDRYATKKKETEMADRDPRGSGAV